VRLAALVIKARAYGKIDLKEWDSLFQQPPRQPPAPALIFGTPPPRNGAVICGTYPPNPLETAADLWRDLPPAKKLELAKWVITYVADIVDSINLDEAYLKTTRKGWDAACRRILSIT
jgi:hypothetical protein